MRPFFLVSVCLPSEIAQLQNSSNGVQKKILWFDVAMAYAEGMDVGQTSEELVHVQLDLEHGHGLLDL